MDWIQRNMERSSGAISLQESEVKSQRLLKSASEVSSTQDKFEVYHLQHTDNFNQQDLVEIKKTEEQQMHKKTSARLRNW
jgi:hypothetical protein